MCGHCHSVTMRDFRCHSKSRRATCYTRYTYIHLSLPFRGQLPGWLAIPGCRDTPEFGCLVPSERVDSQLEGELFFAVHEYNDPNVSPVKAIATIATVRILFTPDKPASFLAD